MEEKEKSNKVHEEKKQENTIKTVKNNKPKKIEAESLILYAMLAFVAVVVIAAIGSYIDSRHEEENNTANVDTSTEYVSTKKQEYETSKKIYNNPYQIVNDLDGLYEFSLISDNDSGYLFESVGVISFENGNAKLKCKKYSLGAKDETKISDRYESALEGYCGTNSNDNNIFYFLINDDDMFEVLTYKYINRKDNDIQLEQVSEEYDLNGCQNKQLNLTKINNEQDFDAAYSEIIIKYENVTVTDLSKMSREEAKQWLKNNNLNCNIAESYSSTVAKDGFINQSVAKNNTAKIGSTVTLTYSLGREPTVGEQNALASAKIYANSMHMSKKKLYHQLTSSYGDGFSASEAQYAVDNVNADWNANALASAEIYQEQMHMSKSRIYQQLTSSYGDNFTASEAQYAIDNLPD